jgi:hypothetical protein
MDPRKVVASFDSASVLHASVVAALEHRNFPHLGSPAAYGQAVRIASTLPWPILKQIYARIGGAEGVDPRRLGDIDMQRVAASFADAFRGPTYPGVMIGSSNGALTQLAAAMGTPWLPSTLLIPVHRVGDPKRADLALRFGREVAPALLRSNPGIVVHQMHDAAQDELMVARMSYFRTKWRSLPEAYERFLSTRLEDGAPIILVDDSSQWPVTRVSDRHVFQVGGRGGLTPDDYLARAYSPEANDHAPEAEWGSEPGFTKAVRDWAKANRHPLVHVQIDGPQEAAHPVATVLRRWIADRGGDTSRLIVPSFVLGDPWRTIMTGQVPFWTFFPVQPALESLRYHLEHSEPYARADILVFQHGVNSPGSASPADFAVTARDHGAQPRLLALHSEKSPHDLGTLGRYGGVMAREPDAGIPFVPLSLDDAADALGAVSSERGRSIVVGGGIPSDRLEAPDGADPLVRATVWLNNLLDPVLGPPPVEPAGDHPEPPVALRPCPICGQPMGDHAVEHVDGHTVYHHPGNEPASVMEGS